MLDFPASPTSGQTYVGANGIIYMWTGTLWVATAPSGTTPGGDFCATYNTSIGTTLFTVLPNSIVSGNAGSWYSSSTGRFTPPAGRYFVYAVMGVAGTAAASQCEMVLRKNGVSVAFSGEHISAGGNMTTLAQQATLDLNGTDYADVQVRSANSAGSGSVTFGAYPITGIKGPPGDPGQLGWRRIATQTVSSSTAFVDFNPLPADINHLQFMVTGAVPVTNDVSLIMQVYNSVGTLDAGGNYNNAAASPNTSLGIGAAVPATTWNSGTGIMFTHNGASNYISNVAAQGGISLEGRIPGIRYSSGRRVVMFQSMYINAALTVYFSMSGAGHWLNIPSSITGVRFLMSNGNIASGMFTVWGSP